MPNSMWNGNYGSDEQARRSNYDRGSSNPYTSKKAQESVGPIPNAKNSASLKDTIEPVPTSKAIPKDVAKGLLDK